VASPDELRLQIEELRASRARIAAAGDAARRRIERDLHDGTQQHLVAVVVKLQLARELTESDPPAARELLDEIRRDVHDTLDCVRELAQAIYPPLLLDRGLGDALASAASQTVVPTRVEVAGLDRYAPEIEATVYFCCLEALDRMAAQATSGVHARIRAWAGDAGLHFQLRFDGDAPGASLPETALDALRDRLGAVDGTLVSESEPGAASHVLGTIPLAR
jgi:signal transduction histidine kinase